MMVIFNLNFINYYKNQSQKQRVNQNKKKRRRKRKKRMINRIKKKNRRKRKNDNLRTKINDYYLILLHKLLTI